jgi:prepilin-type N-terminal cleavage/methylation domain-containing protein
MLATMVQRRRGMSLIELLVVISILGLLAVTVIPNISNTSDRRKVREAARALSSFIAGGQSRALGSRNGGGVWIDPLPNGISNGTIAIGAAIDLADADVGMSYSGNSTSSRATFPNPMTASTTGTVTLSGGCTPPSASGNLIRLENSPALFAFSCTSGSTGVISMRSDANQTVANTFWPRAGASLSYEIIGPPTRSPANTMTFGDGVAIDLYHSCSGTTTFPNLNAPTSLATGTAAFQILYDSTGRPQYLSCNGARAVINEPIFLLVASIESIQSSSGLAPQDGYWVAIDPRGGIPKVAEVDRSGSTIEAQQSFIRSGAVQYGR